MAVRARLRWAQGRTKTLANPADKEEIVQRLVAIGPASQRRWGRMTAADACGSLGRERAPGDRSS